MKKIAIIGRGTAGAYSAGFYLAKTDWLVDWYYDSKIEPQAVGEGSTLTFPDALSENLKFSHRDLLSVHGSYKSGIKKTGWGTKDFFHGFALPHHGYHFNAVELQKFTINKLKSNPRLTIIDKNVSSETVDADYVMDCSGKPSNYDDYKLLESIPVNSVYVTQCFWDRLEFQYTLAIARPHGWVFGIPLTNRCSIGYMYNNQITSLDEIKEDVKVIFNDYGLTPSNTTNSFSFKNYYKKQNFVDNIAYNGNASFFLEPLEATSIDTMGNIMELALDLWNNKISIDDANDNYIRLLRETEHVIMMHYCAGSKFDSDFWTMAQQRGEKNMIDAMNHQRFVKLVDDSKTFRPDKWFDRKSSYQYGSWFLPSFKINLEGLDLYSKLEEFRSV